MWRHHLVEYLAAKARHNEARRLFDRATRTFFTLAGRKGVEEERAYTIAGLGLADKRMVSAYQAQIGACDRLLASLRCESTTARLLAKGAVLSASGE
jgi:hypothetical protein